MDIDYQKKIEEIEAWIKKTVEKAGFKKVVIALSGGIDSALACALAVKSLGPDQVFPLLLPYGNLNLEGTKDALLLCDFLKIDKNNIKISDIKPAVEEIIKLEDAISEIRKGNIMARVRMIYLFDLAKKNDALVIGTENKTEHYLGYFTRFGDSASDLEPIINLYKTQVWEMAKYLNLPKNIIEKTPTAGLWLGQSDENELGFSYKDADQILNLYFDEKMKTNQIMEKGFKKELIEKVLDRVKQNEFKQKLPFLLQE